MMKKLVAQLQMLQWLSWLQKLLAQLQLLLREDPSAAVQPETDDNDTLD